MNQPKLKVKTIGEVKVERLQNEDAHSLYLALLTRITEALKSTSSKNKEE